MAVTITDQSIEANYFECDVTATYEGASGACVRVTSTPSDYGDKLAVEARMPNREYLALELTETEVKELIVVLGEALVYQREHLHEAG